MGISIKEDNVRSVILKTEEVDSLQREILEELKPILKKQGINLDIEKAEIKFFWLTDKVEEKRTRNAGKKKKEIPIYTLEEIYKMMAEEGMEKVYKFLGISRATFYRRLKESRSKQENGEKNPIF